MNCVGDNTAGAAARPRIADTKAVDRRVREGPKGDIAPSKCCRTNRSMEVTIRLFRVSIVQCRGSAYEVGRAQARLFAATPKGRAFLRRDKARFPWWFKISTEERIFKKYAPALCFLCHNLPQLLPFRLFVWQRRFGSKHDRGCNRWRLWWPVPPLLRTGLSPVPWAGYQTITVASSFAQACTATSIARFAR